MAWVINPFTGEPMEKVSAPPEGSLPVKNVYVNENNNLVVEYEGE